jgi:hypothetical protein
VDSWLAQPSVTVVHPGPRHAQMLRDLLLPLGTAGNLTTAPTSPRPPLSTGRNSVHSTTTLHGSGT